ncbi:MAG: hypothetical protein J2O48_07475 [Solirubrobacterales bacterium]|nr:hypothetical protein [Solirubrobacterales bacterium]
MGIIVGGTVGLVLWIFLWTLGVSGFDAILPALGFVLIAAAIQSFSPRLGSDKRE